MTLRHIIAKFTPPSAGPGWCCLRFSCGHELLDQTKKTPPIGGTAVCPQCASEQGGRA